MENKSHALAAGAFVLALLALLVSLAVWLTRDTSAQREYAIASADAVTGLQPQASVRYKGVKVGKVTRIGFDPLTPGHLLVTLAIDDQAPITRSTFATLGFQGVTGLAFVQLDDSGESKVALTSDNELPPRIPMRPSLLAKLSDQGASILSQLDETSRRINLLLAPDNQKKLMGAVSNLGQAATSIQQFSSQANEVFPQLVEDTNATLKTMRDTSVRVGTSAEEARASARAFRTLTERMNAQGGTLDKLAEGVDALAVTGQALNASTLPRLNRAIDDTARTVRQFNEVAGSVNDNPQSLIFGNKPPQPGPGEPGFSRASDAR